MIKLPANQNNAFYPQVPPITIELTNNCNLKCPYCSNSVLDRKRGYIDWGLLEKTVDESSDGRHNISMLHGTGEPLLWDRLEEVIRLIKARKAGDASFATNGTLLNERRIESLLEAGLGFIRVSLDSMDEKIYKQTRGADVHKVIQNIQSLIRLAPEDFQITVALMNHKDQKIDHQEILKFYRLFGVHQNVVLDVVNNGLMPSSPADYRETPIKTDHCFRPADWFSIFLDGKVSICCSDQNTKVVLGNIYEETINDIWYSQKNQETLKNVALGMDPCPDFCTSQCWLEKPSRSGEDSGNPGLMLPFDSAFKHAQQSFLAGDFVQCGQILDALSRRDPYNADVKYWSHLLKSITQTSEQDIYKKAAEERLQLIERLNKELDEKESLIRSLTGRRKKNGSGKFFGRY